MAMICIDRKSFESGAMRGPYWRNDQKIEVVDGEIFIDDQPVSEEEAAEMGILKIKD